MDPLLKKLRSLEATAEKLGQGVGCDAIFDGLFSGFRSVVPCDRLAVGFLQSDGQTLILGPVCTKGPVYLKSGHRESIRGTSLDVLLKAGKTRILNNLPNYAASHRRSKTTQLLVREGMKSSLTVPLAVDGKPLGAMWLSSREVDAYLPEHETFLRLFASHLALNFEKARLASRRTVDEIVKLRLREENEQLREILARSPALTELIGTSPPWRKSLQRIEAVAASDATVLILGETGTGKELIARAIHNLSSRKTLPFVAVNCGALPRELIASELFGHEKGAFTGATQRRLGRIELAQGGTLFLDEIADLPTDMQVKLLRVLQEREFERVGGTEVLRAHVRVIAATNRNLERARAEGRFRDDLFFRLNVFPLRVPPLRERKEDIEPLLRHFLARYAQKTNKPFEGIEPATLERCLWYDWPGNVRELENLVERGVILSRSNTVFS